MIVTWNCISTQAKKAGLPIPKILGLSASLVLQAVKVSYLCQIYPNCYLPPLQLDQFRSEKARLEQILDAEVETAEELSLAKYVNSANEEVVIVPRGNVPSINAEVLRQADEAQKQLRLIRMNTEIAINAAGWELHFNYWYRGIGRLILEYSTYLFSAC